MSFLSDIEYIFVYVYIKALYITTSKYIIYYLNQIALKLSFIANGQLNNENSH